MLNPQYNSCDLQVPSYRQISESVLSTGKQHTLPVLELHKSSMSCVINTFIVFNQRADLIIKNAVFMLYQLNLLHFKPEIPLS